MSKIVYDEILTQMVQSGLYRVTPEGHIETCRQWRGRRDAVVPWYRCDRADGCGYRYVSHRRARVKAHRLAYMLHNGVTDIGGLEVNHLDGNPLNNSRENLELCGPHRQSQHAYDTGLNPARGVKHVHAKLTPDIVREMRLLRSLGVTYARLAKVYGVTPRAAKLAITRETWAHVH